MSRNTHTHTHFQLACLTHEYRQPKLPTSTFGIVPVPPKISATATQMCRQTHTHTHAHARICYPITRPNANLLDVKIENLLCFARAHTNTRIAHIVETNEWKTLFETYFIDIICILPLGGSFNTRKINKTKYFHKFGWFCIVDGGSGGCLSSLSSLL